MKSILYRATSQPVTCKTTLQGMMPVYAVVEHMFNFYCASCSRTPERWSDMPPASIILPVNTNETDEVQALLQHILNLRPPNDDLILEILVASYYASNTHDMHFEAFEKLQRKVTSSMPGADRKLRILQIPRESVSTVYLLPTITCV